jgi:hypothetical protein
MFLQTAYLDGLSGVQEFSALVSHFAIDPIFAAIGRPEGQEKLVK